MESPQYSTPRLSDFSSPKGPVRLFDLTSDEVVRHSLETLQSLLSREANVEERLEEIEITAEHYRMRQKILKDKIFFYRAVFAPVRKLSTEVLVMIFGFLLESSPDDIRNVGLVCTQWRSATLSRSFFWSHIIVARDCHASKEMVTMFHTRSDPHLLRISYSQSIDAERRWSAWDELLSTVHRWATAALTFHDCRSASLRIPSLGVSPLLKELSITIRRQSPRSIDEGKYGFDLYDAAKTPSLRSLILSTHVLPRASSWFTKLTKLHIIDTFANLSISWNSIEPMHGRRVLDVLRCCQSLEEFSFEAENSMHWFISAKATMDVLGWPVLLPNLRHLHLTCHYTVGYCLLKYIEATEHLEDVALRLLPRYQSLTQLELAATARKFFIASPRIRSLSLYGINHRGIVGGLKHGLTELQELHLKHVSGLGPVSEFEPVSRLENIARCLLQDPTKAEEDSWHAPRLSKISIDANWNDVPFDQLALAIKARYSASIRHGKPSRIQTYVVNDQNLLDDAAPGYVTEYKRPQRFCFPWKPPQ